jgi:hypothetical protein
MSNEPETTTGRIDSNASRERGSSGAIHDPAALLSEMTLRESLSSAPAKLATAAFWGTNHARLDCLKKAERDGIDGATAPTHLLGSEAIAKEGPAGPNRWYLTTRTSLDCQRFECGCAPYCYSVTGNLTPKEGRGGMRRVARPTQCIQTAGKFS